MADLAYVLGHSEFELGRLARQERLIGHVTRDYFQAAGVVPGMRVLDVGSGTGAVAFIAADLVGASGEVVGSDLAPTAVAAARAGAEEHGLHYVSFREGNPVEMSFDRQFDAVVGRYVLLFQANAAEMLRGLARLVLPGGVIVFHEPDWSFVRSVPASPVYDRCQRWIVEVFERVGTSTNMGGELHRAFIDAGLGSPSMRMRAVVGDAATESEWLRAVAELTIVLAPAMEQQGVASLDEIGCDTLVGRMIEDVAANNSMIVGRAEIGAWVRL
jgi:ubiquinone/menaquinone biosynthesis C-methylase UbiE